MERYDKEIRENVLIELQKVSNLVKNDVTVSVQDGVVALGGQVKNQAHRDSAELLAWNVTGVQGVVQEINVDKRTTSWLDDETLAQLATQALHSDSRFKPEKVKLVVNDGWIALAGEVEWQEEKEEIEAVVGKVLGAKGIANNLEVKNPTTVNELKSKIIAAFKAGADHRAREIEVHVENGRVILTGEVRTYVESAIAAAACKVAGITDVDNRLRPSYLLEKRTFEKEQMLLEEQRLREIGNPAQVIVASVSTISSSLGP